MAMADSCDVVIPCRDEAPALPDLLAARPGRASGRSWSTTARATTPPRWRAGSAPRSSTSRGPGTAPPCTPGLEAATADFVAVMDGDGSMDPAELVALLDEVRQRTGRPRGRASPTSAAGCGRGTRAWATRWCSGGCVAGSALPLHDIAPMRVARRRRLLGLGVRGPAFRLPGRAAAAGRAPRTGGSSSATSATTRARPARGRRCRGSVLGTIRAARDFARVLS